MAEESQATIGTPRVIAFTGPEEGVGKTTLVLNLAIAWAEMQKRPVLIVPLDPLARQEHGFYLGIKKPVAVADLVRALGSGAIAIAGGLLRGKVSMVQVGGGVVGVLPLGSTRQEVSLISPKVLLPILSRLQQTFDIFLDVDSSFPMESFAFDVADKIFWVTNCTRAHLNTAVSAFTDFKEMHFPVDRLDIICNQYNLPGAIDHEEVNNFFIKLGREPVVYLTWEESIYESSNKREIEIIVNRSSLWVQEGLKPILRVIESTPAADKNWTTVVPDSDFVASAKGIWEATAPAAGGQGGGAGHFGGDGELSYWDDLKQQVHKDVMKTLEVERIVISEEGTQNEQTRKRVSVIIDEVLRKKANVQLSRDQKIRFINELLDEILGLGPLEALMRDASVTEIMVNAYDKIFIEQKGKLTLTRYKFRNNDQVVQVIKRIVAPLGRRIDESVPLVDARLKDGSRVNAIIAPLAVSGPSLTIRRFSQKPFGPEDYYRFGTIDRPTMYFLECCVKLRKNIIICGGTGTGKTTFLNALSSYIPQEERIVTVEDTAELRLQQEHWVSLESRPPNVEGKGEITIKDLVKNCLRMRPDRIVVGECRGAEALDMLQAMNTGHEGSLATIHANTPRDGLTRLEAMCMMGSADLPIWAIREMISSAVNLIVQLSRFSDGSRKVTYVTETHGQKEGAIQSTDLFRYVQTGVNKEGKVEGIFNATGNMPSFFKEFKAKGIDVPQETFDKRDVQEIKEPMV
ncbi:MAG: Flp pilus assembly complex ATPase component TadA [Elusimicrobiota bacterium]|jgi:pilus assembly protein CpaF|nr:Flp pilus assembly complex ATPase component TadA [Elusimicrobiota bacterium]